VIFGVLFFSVGYAADNFLGSPCTVQPIVSHNIQIQFLILSSRIPSDDQLTFIELNRFIPYSN